MSLFGVSVLLIEDEEGVADVFEEALKNRQPPGWTVQYNVKRADTLLKAQVYLSGGGFDVVLLDLKLPDSQGLDTFRGCFGVAKAPIIVMTGSATMETYQQIIREGAYRCFEKLMVVKSLEWLHFAILACIESYRLRSQVERLQETLFHELRNLITACANCHKWRNSASNEYMSPDKMLEKYNVFLSHGICPECRDLLYPELITDAKEK